MKFSASTIILFGLGVLTTVISASSSPQSRICRGVTGGTFDEWCNQNCNHNPPFCPESLCFCEEEPEPPSQEANTTCVAVGTFGALIPGADEWCASVCLSQPGFCPPAFCSCSNGTAPTNQTLATVNPNVPGCCQGDQQYLFFSGVQDNSSVIYRHSLSSDDSEPEECYVFEGGNPTSIVIDSNDNLWIADPVLGTVTRASTSCEGDVEIVLSWNEDTTVAAPTALAIVAGEGLIVGGTSGAFFIRFATDGTVFDVTALEGLNGTAFITSVIKVWDRTAYFVSTDSRIMEYDLDSQEFAEFDLGNFTTTGFGGITLNDCGLYFTTITSNQIYFCPDADPTRCHLHCAPGQGLTSGDFVIFNETDSSLGCVNTFNPGELVSGCCCDVYITNQGNGCVTGISSERSTGTDEDKMFIPDLLACNLTLPQAIAFYSPNESGDSEDCPAQECTNSDTSIQAGNDPSPADSNNSDSSTGGNTEEEDKSGYESQQKQTAVAQPPLHL